MKQVNRKSSLGMVSKLKFNKSNFVNNIGAALEFYDYIIYALLTPYISQLFFSGDSPTIANVKAIFVFSFGAIARIFGGSILGFISDNFGRKVAMTISVNLMAISTLAIGLLPTYDFVGIIAPILLLVLRFCQGVAYSIEVPGVLTIISESDQSRKGFNTGVLFSYSTVACMFANLVLYLITKFYSNDEILSGIWRVPFLIGASLGILGYKMRKIMLETKDFLSRKNESFIRNIDAQSFANMLKCSAFVGIPALLMIHEMYFNTTLPKFYGYEASTVHLCKIYGMIFSAFLSPLFGRGIDVFGVNNVSKKICILFCLLYPSLTYFLQFGSIIYFLFFIFVHQIFLTGFYTLVMTKIQKEFRTKIRSTFLALSYHSAFIASYWIHTTSELNQNFSVVVLTLFALSAIYFCFTSKD